MSSDRDVLQLSLQEISRSQTEVRKAIEILLVLAETTGIESWPTDMQACYHRAMDELAALEGSFQLAKMALNSGAVTINGTKSCAKDQRYQAEQGSDRR